MRSKPGRVEEISQRLSRRLQAAGHLVPAVEVRETLLNVAAVLDPTVQAALHLFNGQIIAVKRVAEPEIVAVDNRTLAATG